MNKVIAYYLFDETPHRALNQPETKLGFLVRCNTAGLENWEHCEASESEKLKAAEAISSVLSILMRYSELSGRLVCGKRHCLRGADCLSSSLVISLGRIKQSFVL